MKLLCFSSQPPNISKNKSENLIDLNIQEMRCSEKVTLNQRLSYQEGILNLNL